MSSPSSESVAVEEVVQSPGQTPISPSRLIPQPFEEQPRPKLKGRQRLLAGLHRNFSSQSVSRQSRTGRYNGNGKGSVSCMSLNSAGSLNTPSLISPFTQDSSSPAFSTAPTSAVTTPGIQIPVFDEKARIRYLSSLESKTSVPLPADVKATPNPLAEVDEDYFSRPITRKKQGRKNFSFWQDMPAELRMEILTYLEPREIVRCSVVSKSWHKMCFDGQLWAVLDTADFYRDISADALVSIITSAGPFVRDLNLRGCVQLRERWHAKGLSDACRNLENFCLEGCRIDRTSIHNFLYQNARLVHINLCGLAGATNSALKIIAANCPKLEHLNVSWCNNIDTRGLKRVVDACQNLKDLRASEIRGWDDLDFAQLIFERNNFERLILMNCDSLTDESLAVMIEGQDSAIDFLTSRPVVSARRLKHLDLTRCRGVTDKGIKTLVGNIPEIEGLQLSKCHGVFDATLVDLLPTTPLLTHLDLEELEDLTNTALHAIANSPCAQRLSHLSISYCEHMGDTGMLPVLKSCTNLRSLEMDNTRISDLVLIEAAQMVRERAGRTWFYNIEAKDKFKPAIGLRLVAYDCQHVTWTGIREIMECNGHHYYQRSELTDLSKTPPPTMNNSANSSMTNLPAFTSATEQPLRPQLCAVQKSSFPTEIIQLKCFYTYQPTVEQHTKRVLRGDWDQARKLLNAWAEFMIAQEEASAAGTRGSRARRRARLAREQHAIESGDGAGGVAGGRVGGGRRRARSGGCAVM